MTPPPSGEVAIALSSSLYGKSGPANNIKIQITFQIACIYFMFHLISIFKKVYFFLPEIHWLVVVGSRISTDLN